MNNINGMNGMNKQNAINRMQSICLVLLDHLRHLSMILVNCGSLSCSVRVPFDTLPAPKNVQATTQIHRGEIEN